MQSSSTDGGHMLEPIRFTNGKLKILDQLKLPTEHVYMDIVSTEDAWEAIKSMNVRGAPAIAIVALACLSSQLHDPTKLVSSKELKSLAKVELHDFLAKHAERLCTARPTAVNVRKECQRLLALCKSMLDDESIDFEAKRLAVIRHVDGVMEQDLRTNVSIGDHGAEHILRGCPSKKTVSILTHCNTGSLATFGYGTALGVIRSLNGRGSLSMAFCTETRPYNQGSRLTAYELIHDRIPSKLICDSMAAALMKLGDLDAVVVGADRVVANGDTANKIGTYQLAVCAKYHGIPFYVASPLSTIDFSMESGHEIPIEDRPGHEMKMLAGVHLAPQEMECWNPAFDVTPAELITGGIITENGVFKASELANAIVTL